MLPGDDVKAGIERVKLTYEDLILFPGDGRRHELIDGYALETSNDFTTPIFPDLTLRLAEILRA